MISAVSIPSTPMLITATPPHRPPSTVRGRMVATSPLIATRPPAYNAREAMISRMVGPRNHSQDLVENRDQEIGVRLVERHRWADLEHIVIGTVGAEEDTALAH